VSSSHNTTMSITFVSLELCAKRVVIICFNILRIYHGICFKNLRKIPKTPTLDRLTSGPDAKRYEVKC
jgi:hypothetical protein